LAASENAAVEVRPYGLQEQFDDPEQQREASSLGMWVFLVTEVMFFGGLFLGYLVYRVEYPSAFAAGSHSLLFLAGTINTLVLICSSLTMAMAVRSSQVGRRSAMVALLAATLLLGLVFLGVKGYEWHDEYERHHVPGASFQFHEKAPSMSGYPDPRHAQLFFFFYFVMTGLHALHMIVGVGIVSTILYYGAKGRYTPGYHNPVEVAGLYWHFVDIVWIYLFPLLYLIDRHP
jgi:cytochrome c oxidase subunit III